MNQAQELKVNRYEILDKLGTGGMGKVYKVVDRLNDQFVALKELNIKDEGLSEIGAETLSIELLSLANEFQILGSLRHPNIISVLDYGFDEQSNPYFTMDLLEGAQTIIDYLSDKSTEIKIRASIQLIQAITYLHHRNIIHRDLKPHNVMVTHDGTVKVLDFGLALSTTTYTNGSTSGTLAYIAPEVLLGKGATKRSDLYTFGLLLYEIFSSKYPFDRANVNQLISDIVYTNLDLSLIPENIAPIIGRLTQKDPEDRYHNADEVIDALVEATNYQLSPETLAIRESFLQAASFIGRKEELADVWQRILETIYQNKGDVVLVGGESGVGKSRFVAELRVRAMVEPILVIRTRAVSGATGIYHLWRKILQHLIIITKVEEWEASALKVVLSNIDRLLGYDVSDPDDLQGDAEQERVERAVINILQRQTRPVLLILEDLQWANSDSMKLLKRLAGMVTELPVFYLGTFRSEEVPTLPDQIDNATTVMLDLFDSNHIEELMAAILGEIGESQHIVEFIKSETEGNALFVVEVLRALAENAGDLRRIAQMELPKDLAVGGILAILKQRLSRLPEPMLQLLQLVALYGRDIDLELTEAMRGEVSVQDWLQVAEQAAVLRVEDENWLIAHDKMREQLILEVAKDEANWKASHHKIASALEQLYSDDPSHIPALAYHWTEAEVPEKAVDYNHKAAQMLVRSGQTETLDYIKAARSFDHVGDPISSQTKAFRTSIEGLIHFQQGDMSTAQRHLEEMLSHMKLGNAPSSKVGAALGALKQVGRQILHRFFPHWFISRKDSSWVDQKMMMGIRTLPMIYAAQGDMIKALWVAFLELNSSETFAFSADTHPIMSYANMHYLMASVPIMPIARHYRGLVLQTIDNPQAAEKVDSLYRYTAQAVLGFTDMFQGKWADAIQRISLGVAELRRSGDFRATEQVQIYLGLAQQFSGDFAAARDTFESAMVQSIERNDPEMTFYLMVAFGSLLAYSEGISERNLELANLLTDEDHANEHFKVQFETQENHACYKVLQALYYAQREDYDSAWKSLTIAANYKLSTANKNIYYHNLFDGMAYTAYLLMEFGNQRASFDVMRKAVKGLTAYGRAFVFSKTSALRYSGLVAMVSNQPEAALKSITSAIQEAKQYRMPSEEALSHLVLARIETRSQAERQASLQQASNLSQQVGGLYLITKSKTE